MDSIINNYNAYFSSRLRKEEKLNLTKFTDELKKLGIKKVYMPQTQTIRKDTIGEGLTLSFMPVFDGIAIRETNTQNNSTQDFFNHLTELNGGSGYGYHHQLHSSGFSEGAKKLKVEYEGKKYIIGDYLPKRNLIILYLKLNHTNFYLEEFQYLDEIIKYIQEIFKNHKIKEEDTTEFIKELFIEKFNVTANREFDNMIRNLSGAKESLELSKKNIVEYSNKIITYDLNIERLKNTLKDLNEGLFEQLESLKNLKFIQSAELEKEGIKIIFEEIFIEVQKQKVPMGVYEICLTSDRIYITNKSPIKYNGSIYHSPHIVGTNICFGQQESMAYELLGQLQFKKLAHFLYLYLKSFNAGSTYLSMDRWIKGKKNKGICLTPSEEIAKKAREKEKKRLEALEKKQKTEKKAQSPPENNPEIVFMDEATTIVNQTQTTTS